LAVGAALFMVALGVTVLASWFSHTAAPVQFLPPLLPVTALPSAVVLGGGCLMAPIFG